MPCCCKERAHEHRRSDAAFDAWNTRVGERFAEKYIAANSRTKLGKVNWVPVLRELSGPCR